MKKGITMGKKNINVNSHDMTRIYETASIYCLSRNICCPEILYDNVPGKCDYYFKDGYMYIILDDSLCEDEQIDALIEILSSKMILFYFIYNDMSSLYLYASALARSLHIKCPMILEDNDGILSDANNAQGCCINAAVLVDWQERKSKCIFIRNSGLFNYKLLYKSIAHELRHVWQLSDARRAHSYFDGYRSATRNIHEFYMQIAEIDAAAYAYRVLLDIFNVDIIDEKLICNDEEVLSHIKAVADTICPQYPDTLAYLQQDGFSSYIDVMSEFYHMVANDPLYKDK